MLIDSFWTKFKNSYLNELHARSKWKTASVNLKVNDIVLIRSKDDPPFLWPLARVTQVFPDSEGLVRSMKLQTTAGEFQRVVTELVLLPAEELPPQGGGSVLTEE